MIKIIACKDNFAWGDGFLSIESFILGMLPAAEVVLPFSN
jgi:hypothetical protein